MTSWKTAFRSFYYEDLVEPPPMVLPPRETALLVIDIQACYLPDEKPAGESEREWERWRPFRERMTKVSMLSSLKTLALRQLKNCIATN